MKHCSCRSKSGFTLVELLVVIGIIAILIAILLPTLAKARRSAQTVACAANLRSIMQAVHIFAAQNNGLLPGSAYSSGRFLFIDPSKGRAGSNIGPSSGAKYSDSNCPSVVDFADWASPLAKIMNVKFEEGATTANRARRWARIRDLPQFRCPSNELVSAQFGATLPDDPTNGTICSSGLMFSYCAAQSFLLQHNSTGSNSSTVVGISLTRTDGNVPDGYNCKLSKVGDAAKKAFIADGSKYSFGTNAPDTDLGYMGQFGGPFTDQGPNKFTRAWSRDGVLGNGTGGLDCRVFWARHSNNNPKPHGRPGTFRFNVAFFDGHVETMDDLSGADPFMWWPKGTSLAVNAAQMYPDVLRRFFPGGVPSGGRVIVP